MQVNSYLEAFTFVYGWNVYATFYMLFAVTGVLWFPLARIIVLIFVESVSANQFAGENFIKAAITSFIIAFLVFITATVPMKSYSIKDMNITSICTNAPIDTAKHKYFPKDNVELPMLPALAAAFAHGVNAVVYKDIPCTTSIAALKQAVGSLALDDVDGNTGLQADVDRFTNECYIPAQTILNKAMKGGYGKNIQDHVNEVSLKYVTQTMDDTGYLIGTDDSGKKLDSPMIVNMFYKGDNADFTEQHSIIFTGNDAKYNADLATFKAMFPLTSKNPVAGFSSDTQSNGTEQDKAGDGLVSCGTWWTDATNGLRARIIENGKIATGLKVAKEGGIPECNFTPENNEKWISDNKDKLKSCAMASFTGNGMTDESSIDQNMIDNTRNKAINTVTSKTDDGAMGAFMAVGIADTVASFFGHDLGFNPLIKVADFYFETFTIKNGDEAITTPNPNGHIYVLDMVYGNWWLYR